MHLKIKTLHLIHSFTSALVFLPNMDSLVDGNSFLALKDIVLTLFLGIVFQETLAQRCMFLISSESHPTNLLTIYGCINYCLCNIFISLLTFYSPHLITTDWYPPWAWVSWRFHSTKGSLTLSLLYFQST